MLSCELTSRMLSRTAAVLSAPSHAATRPGRRLGREAQRDYRLERGRHQVADFLVLCGG